MRVRRLVEIVSVTLLIIAVISVRDIKLPAPIAGTKATVTTLPASLATKLLP